MSLLTPLLWIAIMLPLIILAIVKTNKPNLKYLLYFLLYFLVDCSIQGLAKDYFYFKSNSEIQQVNGDRIFIKTEGKLVKILLNEIIYIEAQGDYLKFVLKDQNYSTQATLKSLEETLIFQSFFRVQRSFIINLEAVRSVHGNLVELTSGTSITIAPNKKEELLRLLGIK